MASSPTQDLPGAQKTDSTSAGVTAAKEPKAPSPKDSRAKVHEDEAASAALQAFTKSTLYKLPPELRNRVYRYALATDDGFCNITEEDGIPEPSLLFTCKHIRKEAIGIYYSVNKIALTMKDYRPATRALLTRKKIALRRALVTAPSRYSQRCVGTRNWENLKSLLRGIHERKCEALRFDKSGARHSRLRELLSGMEKMVVLMTSQPWEEVEDVIDSIRVGLVALRPEWARDHVDSD